MLLTRARLTAAGSLILATTALLIHPANASTDGQALSAGVDTATCSRALVTVDYDVAYSAALDGFEVTSARVSGLDPTCARTVTLNSPQGAAMVELISPVVTTSATIAVPRETPVRAEAVSGVSVVLSG